MLWGDPLPEKVAPATVVEPLLERALAAAPGSPALHEKLGYLHLDRFDFAAAAAHFEQAIAVSPASLHTRVRLARSYNMMQRPADALRALAGETEPLYERGAALMKLGEAAQAEGEFRALLAVDADHAAACRKLCRLLRTSGRTAAMLDLCEDLAARGARNAQFFYNWGWALALAGEAGRAARLLVEPDRIVATPLPVPEGFADLAAFTRALAEEILANPHRLARFSEDEANRGSERVESLFTGARPDLIAKLVRLLEAAAAAFPAWPREGFDPWPRARPSAARIRSWGLIQREGAYEAQHLHPSGWLSGVYYVRVPEGIYEASDGRGAIEFGPPRALEEAMPGAFPAVRIVPREGLLLLSPSHYPHRTIPSGLAEDRISIAFDVVPDRSAA